jgi:hypothetical protein
MQAGSPQRLNQARTAMDNDVFIGLLFQFCDFFHPKLSHGLSPSHFELP